MSNLIVKGNTTVCGIEVPIVYGGFGKNQKVMLAKTVAEIHNIELKVVNQNIKRHINDDYFEEGIDFIDLKGTEFEVTLSDSKIYTKNALNASKNIYLLSQRGYTLLLKLMDSELARKQYKEVIDDYFKLKEKIEKTEKVKKVTSKDIERLAIRMDGTFRRKRETASITKMIGKGELPKGRKTYKDVTNITYYILYGMNAKELRDYLDLGQKDNLRDYLSQKDLEEIREIEDEIHYMEKKGHSWEQIYEELLEEYPEKIKPQKARKSIREIRNGKRLVVGDKVIGLLG